MKLTSEQLATIQSCNSAQEIVDKAKESGFDVSREMASDLLKNITSAAEDLDLDDLDQVAGGASCDAPDKKCRECGSTNISYTKDPIDGSKYVWYNFTCSSCKHQWQQKINGEPYCC